LWHIADVPLARKNVCFERKNGHDAGVTAKAVTGSGVRLSAGELTTVRRSIPFTQGLVKEAVSLWLRTDGLFISGQPRVHSIYALFKNGKSLLKLLALEVRRWSRKDVTETFAYTPDEECNHH
jgi:hypothetical protein